MSNFVTRAVAGLSANALSAWQWAKAKLPTTLPPGFAEIEPHLREFLSERNLLGDAASFDHGAIAVAFAAFVADPTHSFGAAFAHLPLTFVKNLTIVAAKDGLQYLASKGEIGPHQDLPKSGDPLLDASIAGVFGKIAELEAKPSDSPPAVAGKIEPKPDGPKGAA